MKKVLTLIIIVISFVIAQPQTGSVPNKITFQGILSNPDGSLYEDGAYDIIFRLYETPNQGDEVMIWEEAHLTDVENGLFSVILGSDLPFPDNISGNAMLEIQVLDEILSPRQSFSSVPFSLTAKRANMSMHAMHADSAMQSFRAVYADTAQFALTVPMSDSAQFSFHIILIVVTAMLFLCFEIEIVHLGKRLQPLLVYA